jgi:hypothetical protein
MRNPLCRIWLTVLLAAGCAVNLSESRPARVLRGGEIQISDVSSLVVPLGSVDTAISGGKTAAKNIEHNTSPSPDDKRQLVGSAAAIGLTGPGYGNHLEIAAGFGYRLDTALRIGNGIYSAALRRGFDLGSWDSNIGVRLGYNSGESVLSYLDTINSYAKITDTKRVDMSFTAQIGREFGEWGKIWAVAKTMYSRYSVNVDAQSLDLGREKINDHLLYYGGALGAALGFRWIHFVMELGVYELSCKVNAFGNSYDLSGVTITPSWGFQGTF